MAKTPFGVYVCGTFWDGNGSDSTKTLPTPVPLEFFKE
jgi:hypothetical protein